MILRLLFLPVILFVFAADGRAEDQVPRPQSKSVILKQLDKDSLPEEQHVKELSAKVRNMEKDVEKLQKELREKSKKVENTEKEIAELTKEISLTESDYQKQLKKLTSQQSELSDVIMALYRLQKMPDEAAFLDPAKTEEMITMLAVTKNLSPQLQKKISETKLQLEKLRELKEKKEKTKQAKSDKTKDLKTSRDELEDAVNERNESYRRTVSDLEKRKKEAEEAAKYANSLQELVSNLARKNKEQNSLKEEVSSRQIEVASKRPAVRNLGNTPLPVKGKILTAYGETDSFGAKSDGLTISPDTAGFVVTPLAGKIRYAGEFKNYGNMIIVEHKKNYFSLIAGLDKIDTVVGQILSTGEPVGQIRGSDSGKTLYYELRQNSKPVNPVSTLKSLI